MKKKKAEKQEIISSFKGYPESDDDDELYSDSSSNEDNDDDENKAPFQHDNQKSEDSENE
jgi:hypothetical protein